MSNNIDFPKSKWLNNWGIDQENAKYLDDFIKRTKPEIILETGTFEAQSTYVMAQAANYNNNNCHIYTIDYDGDPTTILDKKDWLLLKDLRNKNLEKIKNNFKNVTVKFLEGDSRIVLKSLFKDNNIKKINLFFQDSMHFKDGIIEEWDLVKKYIYKGCYAIFDDLKLKGVQEFRDWFNNKYKNKLFQCKSEKIGHGLFIAKKITNKGEEILNN